MRQGRERRGRGAEARRAEPADEPAVNRCTGRMKKDYHINIFYSEADDGYIADIPDLEACSAYGKTPAKALE